MKNVTIHHHFALLLLISILGLSQIKAQWVQTNGPYEGYNYFMERWQNKLIAGTGDGVYTSTNEGVSWERLSSLDYCEGYFTHAVISGDSVYMLKQVNDYNDPSTFSTYLFYSYDAGNTWSSELFNTGDQVIGFSKGGPFIYIGMGGSNGRSITRLIPGDPNDAIVYSNANAFGIYFNADENRVVLDIDGDIEISDDFGNTWSNVLNLNYNYANVYFEDSLIIVSLSYGKSYYSRNFGITWDSIVLQTDGIVNFEKADGQSVIGFGDSTRYFSDNNGLTWNQQPWPVNMGIPFVKTDYGYLHGGFPYRCDNNGNNNIPSAEGLKCSRFDRLIGNESVLISLDYDLTNDQRSLDGGNTWEPVEVPDFNMSGMVVKHKDNSIFVLETNILHISTDLGATWNTATIPQAGDYLYSMEVSGDYLYYGMNLNGSYGIYRAPVNYPDQIILLEDLDPYSIFPAGLIIHGDTTIVFDAGNIVYKTGNSAWTSTNITDYVPTLGFSYAHIGNTYFTISNLAPISLLISYDGGISWSYAANGLPEFYPFEGITMGAVGNEVFLNSPDQGFLYYSNDLGVHWQPVYQECIPDIYYILSDGQSLYASTTRSVWKWKNTFQPTTISVYWDANGNNSWDANETGIPNAELRVHENNLLLSTDQNGLYSGLLYLNDSLTVNIGSGFYSTSPEYFLTNSGNNNYSFALHFETENRNAAIELVSPLIVSGAPATYSIHYSNIGSLNINGRIVLYPDSDLAFLSASVAPELLTEDSIVWNINNLQPFDYGVIQITFQTFQPLGTPIDNIVLFITNQTDDVPENNIAEAHDIVAGSYDPNNKSVFPKEIITPEQVSAQLPLTYTVRFQNTGNYPANLVRIADTLDIDLDINTLKILAYSHPMTWTLNEGRILEFTFNNINLPDSTSDEPGSHGYVEYAIQCAADFSIGTGIQNTAYIYFDYNAAIVTNTVNTFFGYPDATNDLGNEIEGLKCYPNPSTGKVWIVCLQDISSAGLIRLISLSGEVVLQQATAKGQSQTGFDLNALPPGIYFVQWLSPDGLKGNTKVIKM